MAWWLGVYLALVIAPLAVLMIGGRPAAGGLGWDFAMALGYAGIAMTGIQFALTARFRHATAPFGIDIVYYFHRWLAVLAFVLIGVHVAVLSLAYPAAMGPLDPRNAPWPMTAGRAAFVLFGIVVVTSLWRRQLRIAYDGWRRIHAALTTLALVLAIGHVAGSGHYLDTPVKRVLWVALAGFWLLLVVNVRLVRPFRMLRRPWQVRTVRREPGRSWTLEIEPVGHAGLRFAPGQFAWLSLRASPFALREHPFSIASSPLRTDALEFTIKELGDFTRTIGTIRPGEPAWIDGPFGAFTTDRHPRAPGLVFIAGGVGVAPIMSMLRTFAARGERRPLRLFYGNRRWERVVFREELAELAQRLDLALVHILGEPPADWAGESGLLTRGLLDRHLPDARAELEYFVCGPDPMIRVAERSLVELGVPLRRIHSEIFQLA
ncbi:MAG TPA: ferric reductase-like transmembrane domain-containing protein [Xanthomonadaceae bacterium]|nr:ferric reductase-like transmembrane domain-containing protein [Xanthomonadaceae bacterium]